MEGIYDLYVLDIRDSVPAIAAIAATFHVVPEAFLLVLLNSLEGFRSGRTLICALKVPNEHGT
jgi:hypothetical protein